MRSKENKKNNKMENLLEKVEKGNEIAEEIKLCKKFIKAAKYTQSEDVLTRETYLKINGVVDDIIIPDTLFRIVGKLILAEYNEKLIELQKRLNDLYEK